MTRRPESTARRYGKVFDEIAVEYDRYRPAYPDELIDQACRVAGIGSGDHVLEVGCGSGQLTRGLVARGLHVTALEPGTSLIALARQNLEDAGEVEFVNAQFEDALLPASSFGPCSLRPRFTGWTLRLVGRRPLTHLFPVERSPSCNISGLKSRAAGEIRRQHSRRCERPPRKSPLTGRPTGISMPRSLGWSNAVATSPSYGPGSAATT